MPSEPFRLRGLTLVSSVAVVLAIAVVGTGLWGRKSRAQQLDVQATERAIPTVALVAPQSLEGTALELPARVESWSRAPIHARVSGYLKRWTVDIGSPIKAGQLLAEIETPELDQQLTQARAELASATSSAGLSSSTAERWQSLLDSDAVSRQEVDERTGDLAAKQSAVRALQANVDRLLALQRYARLVAPFDGVVTSRNTDIGALITAGGASGSDLFVIADHRRLRVYVTVPQRQVAQVRAGAKAVLQVPERPGKSYDAVVHSLAQVIGSSTGGMLVQLAVDNASGELIPGGFATVRFDAAVVDGSVALPPGALIHGQAGVRVATVDATERVRLHPVTIVRDFGPRVAVDGPLRSTDRVIENPPDGIADGDAVRVAVSSVKGAS